MGKTEHDHDEEYRVDKSAFEALCPTQDVVSKLMEEMSVQLRKEMKALLPQIEERIVRTLNARYAQAIAKMEQRINALETEICYIHQESRKCDD